MLVCVWYVKAKWVATKSMWILVSFGRPKAFYSFTSTYLSHPGLVKVSLHMCFHIPFFARPNSKFFSVYWSVCSVLIAYLPNPVICVLPSVIKITRSFSFLFCVWFLGQAMVGVIIVFIFFIWTLRTHTHNIHNAKN